MKDKIEAQSEVKAKEKEEKDLVAQQVLEIASGLLSSWLKLFGLKWASAEIASELLCLPTLIAALCFVRQKFRMFFFAECLAAVS